jgi:hypothetical protein
MPANLDGATSVPENATVTYDISSMTIATPAAGSYGVANIAIDIFQMATCQASDVVITVS